MDQNLDEMSVGSSYGDPSSVEGPVTPKGGTNHNRPQDKKDGDKSPVPQGSSLKTKAAMIGDMVRSMNGMSAASVKAAYKSFNSANGDATPPMQGSSKIKESYKITTADIDLSEDLGALLQGDDLTEEFKSEATDLFETAVVAQVNAIVGDLLEAHEADLEGIQADLEAKLDGYLDYVVEQWMEENEIAVESGIRTEMAEDFLEGLRNLFAEHYINVPEEKMDMVEELVAEVDKLKDTLDEEMNKHIGLVNENEELKKTLIIGEEATKLAVVDRAKFIDLAESVEFEDEDSYRGRLDVVMEKYFGLDEEVSTDVDTWNDEPVELDEETEGSVELTEGHAYADKLSRYI